MKSEGISFSETRGEPYQRWLLLCDASHPIVPHPPPSLSRMSGLSVALSLVGRIHHARGCAVATCHLANLLHHHRLRCGDADGLDVRGGDLDRGGAGARVGAEGGVCDIQHAQRRAFLPRAAGRRDTQRTLAGALAGGCAAWPLRSRGGNLRRHRAPACAPADRLSTGAARLALTYALPSRLLYRAP